MLSSGRVAILALVVCGTACGSSSETRAATVTWRACEAVQPATQCGTLLVDEQRSHPGRRTIPLNVVVQRASRPAASEPVFALAGGPGEGSTGLLAAINRAWPAVRDRRDIVLVDQRGTGRSNPLHCQTRIAEDPAAAFGHVFDPAVVAACREGLAKTHDLSAYTTTAAADDLEDLRRALGYDRILIWGGSYGSRLAQAYMQRHPDRVALAVLDGVAPLDVAVTAQFGDNLQRAIDRTLADCRREDTCRAQFPALDEDWQRLIRRLHDAPAQTHVTLPSGFHSPVTMSLGDFAYAVRGILYASTGHDELPAMIHQAAVSGDLSQFADRYWQRAMRLGDTLALGLHLSVLCHDEVRPTAETPLTERSAAGHGTMGRYLAEEYLRACRAWNVHAAPAGSPPATLTVPALLLSGEFDPSTPPAFGARVAALFPRGRHDVAPRGAHGLSFSCAREAVSHVLTHGTLAAMPPVCPADSARQ